MEVADRVQYLLTFYASVVKAVVSKYESLQYAHSGFWFGMYLIATGMSQDDAIAIASQYSELVDGSEQATNMGAVALHVWLEGDTGQAASILGGLMRMA